MNSSSVHQSCKKESFTRFFTVLCTVLVVLSLLLSVPATVRASVYYVDAAQPDDTGDGLSWETAMRVTQTAIDSSAVGDTILVKYGEYYITSAILLDSDRMITSDDGTHDSWDSAVYVDSLCVVEASLTSRVFTITGATVTGATRIRGFKITGGRATGESPGAMYGGGIYIAGGADPVIEYCWITQNIATTSGTGYGGGIACNGGGTEPWVENSRITDNEASTSWYGYGGGIYCNMLTMCKIRFNEIISNTASTARAGFGGGICSSQSTIDINGNFVASNIAAGPSAYGGEGGGIYVYRGTVDIFLNTIFGNWAAKGNGRSGKGGAVLTSGSGNIDIRNNYITSNLASLHGSGFGGGIYCQSGPTEITGNNIMLNQAAGTSYNGQGGGLYLILYGGNKVSDNLITCNQATHSGLGQGGGIYTNTSPVIERNVIALNNASYEGEGYGGACWFSNSGSTVFNNNTVYGNANASGPTGSGAGSGLFHESGSGLTVDNNIIAGHDVENSDSVGMHFSLATTVRYTCFYNNPGGNYNINVTSINELLADPRIINPGCVPGGGVDFSLQYDSPCIEAGDPLYPVPLYGGWAVDIGAIEYRGTRHLRPVTGAGELLFGGQVKAKVKVTTLGTLSEIDMVVYPGEMHPMAPVSVERWYEIDHVGDGMTFDLTLSYLDDELGGRVEDSLSVWRWAGSAWDGPKATSAADTLENWLTVANQTDFSAWIMTDDWGPTSTGELPDRYRLFTNHPNPFNPTTLIAYELPGPSHVELVIYNVAGQIIRVLENTDKPGGIHRVTWDGRDRSGRQVASGVYFYRLVAGDFVQTKKMVLLR